jgi:hypothetical protein
MLSRTGVIEATRRCMQGSQFIISPITTCLASFAIPGKREITTTDILPLRLRSLNQVKKRKCRGVDIHSEFRNGRCDCRVLSSFVLRISCLEKLGVTVELLTHCWSVFDHQMNVVIEAT